MKITVHFGFLLASAMTAIADGPADNLAEKVRAVPPPGIVAPEKDRAELAAELAALGREIAALRSAPAANAELLPDVEIFHKAVRYALDYVEFFKTNELAAAKNLLQLGAERTGQLRAGKAPWRDATGLVVRAFRSRIDGSVQPYGLVVPPPPPIGAPYRLDIWFHGRGETLSEVISGLPTLQREILDLRFQHDLSYAEIAEALGTPVGTVRSRLHNAMRILRARLALEESAANGSSDDET